MRFYTKLWKRTEKSYATTIPNIVLLSLKNKEITLNWTFHHKNKTFTASLSKKSVIQTKIWKRSQYSFATTMPKLALLLIDPKNKYNVSWAFVKENTWKVKLENA